MKFRAPYLPLLVALCLATNAFAASSLDNVDKASAKLLANTDPREMDYALPQWLADAEHALANCEAADVQHWQPSSLNSVDLGTAWLFYAFWRTDKQSRLVGVARRKQDAGGSLPLAFAFADDLPPTKAVLAIEQAQDEGLSGVSVVDSAEQTVLYTIPDMLARMDLTTVSDVSFSVSQKEAAAAELRSRLGNATLTLAGDLSGMPLLTVADSPDNKVRIVTFYVARKDFITYCGGWLLTFNKKKKPTLTPLVDETPRIGKPEQATLMPSTWYGALYSKIVPFKVQKKTYYALFGFKGADAVVKTRVIDILSVENDNAKFGAPLLLHPQNKVYRRRVFQYSVKASMSIMYDDKSKMIVYDHLAPSEALLTGQTAFYGPDLSYDAYLLTDKGWEYQADIQMTKENGAQPNPEVKETQSDRLTQPANGGGRRNTYSGSSSYGNSQGRKNNGNSKGNAWLDKGKGNSSPTSRKR